MMAWHIDEDDDFFTGEDKQFVFTVYQQNKRTVKDITGKAFSWMLKRSLADDDVDALLVKTTASGITLTTPASGLMTITISAANTVAIEPGRYYHEVKCTDVGDKTVESQGRCVLRRGVHRA